MPKNKIRFCLLTLFLSLQLSSSLCAMDQVKESPKGTKRKAPEPSAEEAPSSSAVGESSPTHIQKKRKVEKPQQLTDTAGSSQVTTHSGILDLPQDLVRYKLFPLLPFKDAISLGQTCKSFKENLYAQRVDNFEPASSLALTHSSYGPLIASKNPDAMMHLAVFLLHRGDENLATTAAMKQLQLISMIQRES